MFCLLPVFGTVIMWSVVSSYRGHNVHLMPLPFFRLFFLHDIWYVMPCLVLLSFHFQYLFSVLRSITMENYLLHLSAMCTSNELQMHFFAFPFLCVFPKVRTANIKFIKCCFASAQNNWALTERIFIPFDIPVLFENLSRNFKFL